MGRCQVDFAGLPLPMKRDGPSSPAQVNGQAVPHVGGAFCVYRSAGSVMCQAAANMKVDIWLGAFVALVLFTSVAKGERLMP
jgi:hypothetical protein